MRLLLISFMGFFLLSSCNKGKNEYFPLVNKSTTYKVKIKEIMQSGNYTYLFVNSNNQNFWIAGGKIDAKIGETVFYENPLVMTQFKSEELDKVFEQILFVQNIRFSPQIEKSRQLDALHQKAKKEIELDKNSEVDKAPGGISIGELYKNRTNYANKKVKIRGRVVKVNENIMDRNWIHLKDGTSNEGKSDLTFTTQNVVKVGDIVTFEGTVSLNKEYGAGYVYPLVVEEAILK